MVKATLATFFCARRNLALRLWPILVRHSDTPKGHPMTKFLSKFVKDENGATAIEYGLIIALIAVVIIAVMTTIGTKINAKMKTVSTGLN
jgi:pilus assembly protein Flp/PilA